MTINTFTSLHHSFFSNQFKFSHAAYVTLLWISLFLIGSASTITAQTTGWVSGYIITDSGDTLRGELFNRDWSITPLQIEFRSSGQAPSDTYTVLQVRVFYLQPSHEHFIRITVRLDKTPYKIDKLQNNDKVAWSDETVFAQQLTSGLMSLATHVDKDGKRHYLVQRDAEVWQDLVFLKYQPEASQVITVERYRQQLGALTYDCPSIKNKLPQLGFNRRALQTFIGAYNSCKTGQEGSYQQAVTKNGVEWGPLAGASLSQLTISIPSSKDYFSDQPYRYKGAMQPTVGIWLTYYLSRNRRQWSIYNDIHYQCYDLSGMWSGNSAQLSGQFAYSYLKLHTALRWQPPKGLALMPFVMLGVSNGFAISHQQSIRTTELNRTYEQAVFGALGLRVGRIGGEIRYERGNGITANNTLLTRTETAFLLVNFAF